MWEDGVVGRVWRGTLQPGRVGVLSKVVFLLAEVRRASLAVHAKE